MHFSNGADFIIKSNLPTNRTDSRNINNTSISLSLKADIDIIMTIKTMWLFKKTFIFRV